ncbi:ECF-type sigma factor [Sphingomonas sp. ID0503]|uniref:ECF-type sigma factor n=1 Tax=Sphingomonas sp. ID0503 TaxID=3399691 RepID=UPI003AFA1D63
MDSHERERHHACVAAGEPQTEELLLGWREGRIASRDRIVARILPELKAIAAARLRAEPHASMSTQDLINDAVLRITAADDLSIVDRAHILALSSRIMRNILIDHARAKRTDKRRHERVELHTRIDGDQRLDLVSLDVALIRLKALDDALAELVEMRYFGGMSVTDVALVTGLSEPTVKRRWQVARAWLLDALANPIDD